MRKVRGDGSCFYRGFVFRLFEHIIEKKVFFLNLGLNFSLKNNGEGGRIFELLSAGGLLTDSAGGLCLKHADKVIKHLEGRLRTIRLVSHVII